MGRIELYVEKCRKYQFLNAFIELFRRCHNLGINEKCIFRYITNISINKYNLFVREYSFEGLIFIISLFN